MSAGDEGIGHPWVVVGMVSKEVVYGGGHDEARQHPGPGFIDIPLHIVDLEHRREVTRDPHRCTEGQSPD